MLLTCLVAAAVSTEPPAAAFQDGAAEASQAGQAAAGVPRVDASALEALAGYALVAENTWRVEGPMDVQVSRGEREGVATYSFDTRMLIDTKLPVGYPQPTPPEAIEIKAYPGVRRAEVSGQGNLDIGMNLGFWPLFQHIDRNGIAMTAPVEIDYHAPAMAELDAAARPEGWTMSFLYERESDGPAGEYGRIEVVDREPMLVLAIGVRGQYRYSRTQSAIARLTDWLDAHPEWEVAGDPRMLGYNGPDRRPADQWSEVQVPIRAVRPAGEPGAVSGAAPATPFQDGEGRKGLRVRR